MPKRAKGKKEKRNQLLSQKGDITRHYCEGALSCLRNSFVQSKPNFFTKKDEIMENMETE